jgi:uncharacterized protein YndB with AHSA1/START domain
MILLPENFIFEKKVMEKRETITVVTEINATIDTVWKAWNNPGDIIQWNAASDDWHTTTAENNLEPGGKFSYRMEAKDGTFGFDFGGSYDEVIPYQLIKYTIGDGRKVKVQFSSQNNKTLIEETFEAENQNSIDMQRAGWQAILDNFRKHCESLEKLIE